MLIAGILAGWKRRDAEHFTILTVQMIDADRPVDEEGDPIYSKVSLAMGDEQLCSLARDLARAAEDRGLDVWRSGTRRNVLDRIVDRLRGRGRVPRPSGRMPPMIAIADMRPGRPKTR